MSAAQPPTPDREFRVGTFRGVEDLPPGRLKTTLERLPDRARENAVAWLKNFHFTEHDLQSLQADVSGGIFYADNFHLAPVPMEASSSSPETSAAAVPASPFPESLIFHSRPGSPNVLYLNFSGETVSGTAWNTSLSRTSIPAVGFSTDSDFSTFSDSEQTAIRRIWQRVAEDYAPFDIDVTTERPATFNNRTAHALITRNTDANGAANPSSTAGGVAYVNVFGAIDYATYRPAWIYHNNIANNESYIAEAVSHEIGHNLGLSHDGKTDGSDYYSGHGSGDISWAPLMGSGYGKNVTQWSRGEYYLANNTQDDLDTIAAKISYQADDHSGTFATSTPLAVSEGTVIATTPETDPENLNAQNKGIIHDAGDVDVFSFAAGSGELDLTISPWISPSGTSKGGNLDLVVELYNSNGELVLASNPSAQTYARLTTTVPEDIYYLVVASTAAGDPYSGAPSGFTAYGSVGQYFISGSVVPSGLVIPPAAELLVADVTTTTVGSFDFAITYSDASGIVVSTISSEDLIVTGPNGYSASAALLSVDLLSDGSPRVATYQLNPPGALWTAADNGLYTISMQPDQVMSVAGIPVPAEPLGTFTVAVPSVLYSASMETNPGWMLEPLWAYGAPQYLLTGPSRGYTGNNIIGYNLSGNYENRLSPVYATTPAIDSSGASSLSLRFHRWLELRNGDTAAIQVSTDGSTWTDVWTTSAAVSDNAWVEVAYPLPAAFDHSPSLQIRWSLSSGASQNDLGWHLDDVQILGVQETTPPIANLLVSDITTAGSSTHPITVTFTDDSAVLIGSLDSADLLVTGPNGYSQTAQFLGTDSVSDSTPIEGSYAIAAPSGSWDAADDGLYEVTLVDNQVEDIYGNATPETLLGSFTVALTQPGELAILPADGLHATGTVGGPFTPSSITYTLSNSGGMPLDWSAAKTASWLSLSRTGGTLAPGESTSVALSINAGADSLVPGVYGDTLAFINETSGTGDANRSVSLTVNSAGLLSITPATDLAATGTEGGPFSPASKTYTLANNGGTTLDWSATATATAPWLTLSKTSGTLLPGSSASVTVSINAAADDLAPATYTGVIDFHNLTTGNGDTTRSASLVVHSHGLLEVTPVSDLAATGVEGGPFTPESQVYTLANNGGTALDWSAIANAAWLTLSTASGSLNPGETASVTVSINAAAAALEPGDYTGSISILNNTTGQGDATRTASLSIKSEGLLTILDSEDLAAAGMEGGPFTPSSTVYTLTNSGGSTLTWSANVTADWLSLSSATGSLAPGETTTLSLSIASSANDLVAGSYTGELNLINTTTSAGTTTRPASLAIHSPGLLSITPGSGFEAAGTEGGPFTPAQMTYTLANNGGMPLTWSATAESSWLSLSTEAGMLEPGEETTVTVSWNAEASLLAPGTHHSSIAFINATSGRGDLSLPVSLTVQSPGILAITAGSDLAVTGTQGGPFSPDNQVYTLSNSGGSDLEWAASETADWLILSSGSGILAPGESTSVTLQLNNAETLPPGEYHASVSFQDVTVTPASSTQSAGSTHSVSLTIHAPGQLAITPATGFHANGYPGGPFQPSEHTYTLTNEGESPLDWSVSTPADWLAISTTSGSLLPGEATNIVVSLADLTATFSPGTNSTTITFTDISAQKSTALEASLTIFELPVIRVSEIGLSGEFKLETTGIPGWTYQLQGSINLQDWFPLATVTADTNGFLQFSDSETANYQHRFYRVTPEPAATLSR